MTGSVKEWAFNGLLVIAIAVAAALTGVQKFSDPMAEIAGFQEPSPASPVSDLTTPTLPTDDLSTEALPADGATTGVLPPDGATTPSLLADVTTSVLPADGATTPSLLADVTTGALQPPPLRPPLPTPKPTQEPQYPWLGQRNIFRALITPTPLPPPRTPTPTPTPSLAGALKGWIYDYPQGKNPAYFHFSDNLKREYVLEEGRPFPVRDGPQTFEVLAEKDGKYGVIIRYEGQEQKFSLY